MEEQGIVMDMRNKVVILDERRTRVKCQEDLKRHMSGIEEKERRAGMV